MATLPPSTLVWARIGRWPWWPATVQPWPEKVPAQKRKLWVRFCGTHDGAAVARGGVQSWIDGQGLRSSQQIPRSLTARFAAAIAEADGSSDVGDGDDEQYASMKRELPEECFSRVVSSKKQNVAT